MARTGYPKEGVHKGEWFTLLLMASNNIFFDNPNSPPLLPGKSASDVMTDFLSSLQQSIFDRLPTLGKARYRLDSNISWIIAVPASYDDESRAKIHAIAITAGYLRNNHHDCLSLVSRPRAALLSLTNMGALSCEKAAVILVIHCGSSIVELCSYQRSRNDASLEGYTSDVKNPIPSNPIQL